MPKCWIQKSILASNNNLNFYHLLKDATQFFVIRNITLPGCRPQQTESSLNSGDGDSGASEIHARAKFRGDTTLIFGAPLRGASSRGERFSRGRAYFAGIASS